MNRSTSNGSSRRATVLAALTLVLTGCASTPTEHPEAMSAARQALDRAEQAGARQYAGAELDESRQHLARADAAFNGARHAEAERLALQSQVSAELASARTEYAKAAEINREMSRGAEALIEEMRRTGAQQ